MLCVSGGFNPDIHLFTQSKGLIKWDESLLTFRPDKPFQNTITLGSVSGNFSYQKTINEINKKLGFLEEVNDLELKLDINGPEKFEIKELWETNHAKKSLWSKSFIDLQNDVTTKDLKQAVLEGFNRIEHLKRFTTNSMGTDQGKISSINALGIVSKILKKSVSEVGTTIYRPPYAPLSFSPSLEEVLISFMIHREKLTVFGIKNNAVFENVGQWKRPWYYKKFSYETMHEAVPGSQSKLEKQRVYWMEVHGKIEQKEKML